jgi:dTDP-4-amino-4,6-dideoxygalactose transaminase
LSPKAEAVFHQFVVRTTHRDELQQHLRSRGVGTSVLYPVPIHDQGAYKDVAVVCSEMTITERSAREILSLPIGPHVGPDQVKEVVAAINSFQSP